MERASKESPLRLTLDDPPEDPREDPRDYPREKAQRDSSSFDSVLLSQMQTRPATGVKGEIGFAVPG